MQVRDIRLKLETMNFKNDILIFKLNYLWITWLKLHHSASVGVETPFKIVSIT